jgi:translation initiation factor 4E
MPKKKPMNISRAQGKSKKKKNAKNGNDRRSREAEAEAEAEDGKDKDEVQGENKAKEEEDQGDEVLEERDEEKAQQGEHREKEKKRNVDEDEEKCASIDAVSAIVSGVELGGNSSSFDAVSLGPPPSLLLPIAPPSAPLTSLLRLPPPPFVPRLQPQPNIFSLSPDAKPFRSRFEITKPQRPEAMSFVKKIELGGCEPPRPQVAPRPAALSFVKKIAECEPPRPPLETRAPPDHKDPKLGILPDPEPLVKHPLQNRWTLWWFANDGGRDWEKMQKPVCSFGYVEDFWSIFQHIRAASELRVGHDYSLFKEGIKPMWEDPKNKNGGRWLVTQLPKFREKLDECWKELAMMLIGEDYADECTRGLVNGAVVNVRNKSDKMAVWLNR